MQLPHPDIDPDGLLEYSVVFTDRSLNHMSARFVRVMQDLISSLQRTYGAVATALVPGGGTTAMEAVARQLATGARVLVIRNGFFSYRWTQIFEAGSIPAEATVCQARPLSPARDAAWAPPPVSEVVAAIRQHRPQVVFAPHVETAAGLLLPGDYLHAVAQATHEAGGLFVLDCVASGAAWIDMTDCGADVLISAPQKGWSGSPACGYVLLGEAGLAAVRANRSTSFSADLGRWLEITMGYAGGVAAYHSTLPTDTIARNLATVRETLDLGLEVTRQAQFELGSRVRALLAARGFSSVAAPGFEAPGVVVMHTDDPDLKSGAAFTRAGVQAAAGVPLRCGEPGDFSTFRLGLFGLDKLTDVDGTVARLEAALDRMGR